ncbi:hypothetical protein [Leclercia sp. CFBP8987]|uniref:hypothetical protein n=1 Tax=Leclercia sp. CFBP8987 TaxID=3096525 RepID=UPI002A69A859|nr:hypothetical protein [Leclercia sp. CFBP8987]MDY0921946.1 hypothetical protein [Leclercia sp. CFBP8987]
MKSPNQIAEIIQYVTKHPGCYMSDIRRDTSIQKGAIASALTELTRVKLCVVKALRSDTATSLSARKTGPQLHRSGFQSSPTVTQPTLLTTYSISAWLLSGAGEHQHEHQNLRSELQ